MKIHLTKNFLLSEFANSSTAHRLGLDNTPPPAAIVRLTHLAIFVLQPLKNTLNIPIRITSGYRSIQLNKAVGGKPTSQHLKGEAADIAINTDINQIPQILKGQSIEFDQCIIYPKQNFIHLSFSAGNNRREILYK